MRLLLTPALLLLVLLLTACNSTAPGTDAQMRDIDRFVMKTLQTLPEIPSIGVAVVRDGKTYARGYGRADVERRVAADAETGYYNGSNTKAYTGVVCAMLAEEGKIDLDAPVAKYLPELHFPDSIRPEQTTLRRFLSHTSEISNGGITFRTAYTGEHSPELLVNVLGMSKPGPKGFDYDNLGYVVASLVIERVTGRKWQDVLDERLFTPLGMRRTTAYMSEARRERIASPYTMTGTGTMELTPFGWKDDSMMHAAGGIATTPADLAKWLEANLTRGKVGSRQVLPAAAFAETHRQQTEAKRNPYLFTVQGYGFGWYQADFHGERALFHGGGFEGWRSVYTLLPEKKLAVGALLNAGFSHSPAELVSAYIYDRLLNVPDVEKTYDEKLAALRTRFDTVKKNQIEETAKRAARVSMLAHPLDAYVGRYETPTIGTLTIDRRGDKLVASIGRLSSELQPFTEPESARVELTPGSGEVLRFQFSTGAAADAVQWDDEVLVRK